MKISMEPDRDADRPLTGPRREGERWLAIARLCRFHHWAKNLIVFAPLIMAHRATAWSWISTLIIWGAFGCVASAAYIFNDLLDVESDRAHPVKRERPLCTGAVSGVDAALAGAALCAAGIAIAAAISLVVAGELALYWILVLAYSIRLKESPVLDLLLLASFYSFRLFAGASAAEVVLSPWLIGFSTFLFFSIGTAKRYAELFNCLASNQRNAAGRGYLVNDLPHLANIGTSSAVAAVVVLALYINSPEVTRLYQRPEFFWGFCPMLLYWTGRLWLIAERGSLNEDPVLFALHDKTSYLILAAGMALWILAGPRAAV